MLLLISIYTYRLLTLYLAAVHPLSGLAQLAANASINKGSSGAPRPVNSLVLDCEA
jgi:hypothetical protein